MDRGAWQATVHGIKRVGQDWVTNILFHLSHPVNVFICLFPPCQPCCLLPPLECMVCDPGGCFLHFAASPGFRAIQQYQTIDKCFIEWINRQSSVLTLKLTLMSITTLAFSSALWDVRSGMCVFEGRITWRLLHSSVWVRGNLKSSAAPDHLCGSPQVTLLPHCRAASA